MPGPHPMLGAVAAALALATFAIDMWATVTGRSLHARARRDARRADELITEVQREVAFFDLVDDWGIFTHEQHEQITDGVAAIETAVAERDHTAAIEQAVELLTLLRIGQPSEPAARLSDRAA